MTRPVLLAGLLVWAGAALLIPLRSRWSRPSLAERLGPFHPGAAAAAVAAGRTRSDGLENPSLLGRAGDRMAALFGVSEGAVRRLARIHSGMSAATFRARQATGSAACLVAGALLATVASLPPPVTALLVLGAPALCFLAVEERLNRRSQAWQRATADELPVVAEQLAMMLNAGYSVGAALTRLGERSRGTVGRDVRSVVNRIHQGLSESEALQEWADRVGVEGVTRLVSVLTLHGATADLGRLVSAEARATRRDLQRGTIEAIERRAQQVWVPVTVATLVPGAVLLAVPFLAALHAFAN